MSRRARSLLLLMALLSALLWQALLGVVPARIGELSASLGHQFVHQEGVGHQHLDDTSLRLDDQQPSAPHVHPDATQQHAFLLPPMLSGVLRVRADAPGVWLSATVPSPFIEGPLRPPRQPA